MESWDRFRSIWANLSRLMAHDHVQCSRILLDTCCLINLFTSAHIEDIISTVPVPFGVAEAVRREALYILPERESAEPSTEASPVSIEPLVGSGLLEVLQPESEQEAGTYIDFAADLDDGEAMPNVIVRGPIFSEPVQVIVVAPMRPVLVKLVGKGMDTLTPFPTRLLG